MPPTGFEPTISAGERPQTYALDSAATGNSVDFLYRTHFKGTEKNGTFITHGVSEKKKILPEKLTVLGDQAVLKMMTK